MKKQPVILLKAVYAKKMSRFDVFTTILIYSGRTSKKNINDKIKILYWISQ